MFRLPLSSNKMWSLLTQLTDVIYVHTAVACLQLKYFRKRHFLVIVFSYYLFTQMEDARNLSEQVRWADAVALVYDVSSHQSFETLQNQLRALHSHLKKTTPLPTVVLANKVDLHPKAHEVTREEGQMMAEEYCCQFFEVSAADGWLEVARAFKSVIHLTDARRKKSRSPLVLRKRRGSVTRHVAHKVLQVVSWSPKRSWIKYLSILWPDEL